MAGIRIIAPERPLRGSVVLPLSKSESTRAVALQYLSRGALTPACLSPASDVAYLQEITRLLSSEAGGMLYAGDGGAVARFALPLAALTPGRWTLDGTPRLRVRPMAPLVQALAQLGVDVGYDGIPGYLPIHLQGGTLRGGALTLDGSGSSQFASALVLVAPRLPDGLRMELTGKLVSLPYLDLSLAMLRGLGLQATREGGRVSIAPQPIPAQPLPIGPDWSAAAFAYALVALSPGAWLDLPGLSPDSPQGDRLTASLFEPLGVRTLRTDTGLRLEHVDRQTGPSLRVDLNGTPDLFPALAVTAALRGQAIRFSGIAHLRDKESDRIDAVQSLLQQCGFASLAGQDWMEVTGQRLTALGGPLDPRHDHRLAMAFSLMALAGPITLQDPACVNKSWPDWWDVLRDLGFRILTE